MLSDGSHHLLALSFFVIWHPMLCQISCQGCPTEKNLHDRALLHCCTMKLQILQCMAPIYWLLCCDTLQIVILLLLLKLINCVIVIVVIEMVIGDSNLVIHDFNGCFEVCQHSHNMLWMVADKYPGDVKRQRNGSTVCKYTLLLVHLYHCSLKLNNLVIHQHSLGSGASVMLIWWLADYQRNFCKHYFSGSADRCNSYFICEECEVQCPFFKVFFSIKTKNSSFMCVETHDYVKLRSCYENPMIKSPCILLLF